MMREPIHCRKRSVAACWVQWGIRQLNENFQSQVLHQAHCQPFWENCLWQRKETNTYMYLFPIISSNNMESEIVVWMHYRWRGHHSSWSTIFIQTRAPGMIPSSSVRRAWRTHPESDGVIENWAHTSIISKTGVYITFWSLSWAWNYRLHSKIINSWAWSSHATAKGCYVWNA